MALVIGAVVFIGGMTMALRMGFGEVAFMAVILSPMILLGAKRARFCGGCGASHISSSLLKPAASFCSVCGAPL